ncbi:MAG: hypothetical protein ACOYK8_00400 [Alphaproteobacteria bacterium]
MERVKDILNEHMGILDNYPEYPAAGLGGVDAVMSRIFHESDSKALHQKVVSVLGAGVCLRRIKASHMVSILMR